MVDVDELGYPCTVGGKPSVATRLRVVAYFLGEDNKRTGLYSVVIDNGEVKIDACVTTANLEAHTEVEVISVDVHCPNCDLPS